MAGGPGNKFVPPPPPPGSVGAPQRTSLPIGSSGGGAGAMGFPAPSFPATSRTLQVWHPWLYPFPGSTDFRVNTVEASPAAGTIAPASWVYKLPASKRGILRLMTWAIANLAVTSDVRWILKINRQPVEGWSNLTFFPGNVPRINASEDAMIPIPFGGTVSVDFVNLDGAAYAQVGAGFAGHYWDQTAEDVWIGQLDKPE